MDTWKKCVLSAGKTHVHKISPFRGGGEFGFWGGGGSADFIFMGAGIFLTILGATLGARLSELVGRQNFSLNSRSVFFKIGVVPARQILRVH